MILEIIGCIAVILLAITLAIEPINKLLHPVKAEIEVESQVRINFTPEPAKQQLEKSKYPEIQHFLNHLPECSWCVACGSYSHYTRKAAIEQDIPIYEITVTVPNNGGLNVMDAGDGHRINFFYNDSRRVYIDNMHNWKLILEEKELKQHLKDKFGMKVKKIGFKDIKL